jgi:hypothetical protein
VILTILGRRLALGTLTLGLAALSGCGGGDGGSRSFAPMAGSDSAYCKTYRAWKVYELDNGEAFDQPNPAALRRWWHAYVSSEGTMLQQAPPSIHDEVGLKVRFIRTRLAPLVEKFDFDLTRMRREGTSAERAAMFQAPPADVQNAQASASAYEDKACGTQPSPAAADVVFQAGRSSGRFCATMTEFNGALDEVASSRFDPNELQTLVTGERFRQLLDGLDAVAPTAIAADVRADTEWFRTRWSDVVAQYAYDIRSIYVDASPEELAVFNRTHPDVFEHASRDTAYEEQVCDR